MRVLVTGGAGFIGSNLVAKLLDDPDIDIVRVVDNLMTGYKVNLEPYINNDKLEFIEADITDASVCKRVMQGISHVSHQAAIGSVPRSINDPWLTHNNNINGTLNILIAAKEEKVNRIVFASSSSVYGDDKTIPKVESSIGNVLSPYALTKRTKEEYARLFSSLYEMEILGLRYFNVFGPNQSPKGPYAAVIPLFIEKLIDNEKAIIHGDGEQSRDFTYVDNVVYANVLALKIAKLPNGFQIYNTALGGKTSVNTLYQSLAKIIGSDVKAEYVPYRKGDIKHSLADISKIQNDLGYEPLVQLDEGLMKTVHWFQKKYEK